MAVTVDLKLKLSFFDYCFPFKCMKKLNGIAKQVKNIEKKEALYRCCSFNGECAMMNNKRYITVT